jgi:hypothetical protein
MKIAIMQPYIFPYIGYFQLINAVDQFIIYDNIEYTKKGWINRNRILANGKDEYITIPIKKGSDYLQIKDRYIADSWPEDKKRLLNKIKNVYQKAPYFDQVFNLIRECFSSTSNNLFDFILNTLVQTNKFLNITTPIVLSSSIKIDHDNLKSAEKVIALCKQLHADTYINPIGGVNLYHNDIFEQNNINLFFIKTNSIEYHQFNFSFIPWLSIIDVMMFNPIDKIQAYLHEYQLIRNAN